MGLTTAQLLEKHGYPESVKIETIEIGSAFTDAKFRNVVDPETPQTSENFLGRRIQDADRGVKEVEELFGAGIWIIGNLTSIEGLQRYGEIFVIEAGRGQIRSTPRVGTLSETQNFGDISEYGAEVFLEALPLFAVAVVIALAFLKLKDWFFLPIPRAARKK